MTDPALHPLVGHAPRGLGPGVGTRFKLVAKPKPGWRGFVECEVLEAREPSVLRYSWVGDEKRPPPMAVTYTLTPHEGGTRLTFEHTGFKGVGGFILAKLMMGPGWRKIFRSTLPAVLTDLGAGATQADTTPPPQHRERKKSCDD